MKLRDGEAVMDAALVECDVAERAVVASGHSDQLVERAKLAQLLCWACKTATMLAIVTARLAQTTQAEF